MHKEKTTDGRRILPISRRSFVQKLAAGGSPVFGETQHRNPDTSPELTSIRPLIICRLTGAAAHN